MCFFFVSSLKFILLALKPSSCNAVLCSKDKRLRNKIFFCCCCLLCLFLCGEQSENISQHVINEQLCLWSCIQQRGVFLMVVYILRVFFIASWHMGSKLHSHQRGMNFNFGVGESSRQKISFTLTSSDHYITQQTTIHPCFAAYYGSSCSGSRLGKLALKPYLLPSQGIPRLPKASRGPKYKRPCVFWVLPQVSSQLAVSGIPPQEDTWKAS